MEILAKPTIITLIRRAGIVFQPALQSPVENLYMALHDKRDGEALEHARRAVRQKFSYQPELASEKLDKLEYAIGESIKTGETIYVMGSNTPLVGMQHALAAADKYIEGVRNEIRGGRG